MDVLTHFDKALVPIFLICSMLGLGMQTTTADIRALFSSRVFLARLLLVNFVIVPLAGIVLVKSVQLAPETGMALLLLACTPGGASALQFTTKIKGAAAYAGSSAGILSLLAILVSPLLLFAAQPGISFIVPYGRALFLIVLFVLGPFAAGIWVRERRQERALKFSKFFVVAGTLAFVALVLLLAGPRGRAKAMMEVSGILSMLGLVLIAMAAGWLMSGRAGSERLILAIVTSMRNAAVCLMIAGQTFPGSGVQTPLVAFSALMLPPNLLLTFYALIRAKRARKGAA